MLLAKFLLPAAATGLGLAFAAFAPQDPKPAEKPAKAEPAASDADRAADALGDLYLKLRKIRAERLDDKPKALADHAAKLYREAVEALEKDDLAKARSLTEAAREIARALELSLNSRDTTPADPDLPPPPKRRTVRYFVYRTDGGKDDKLPPALGLDAAAPTAVRVEGRLLLGDGEDGEKDFVVNGANVHLKMLKDEGARRDVIVEKGADPKAMRIEIKKLDDAVADVRVANSVRATAAQARAHADEARKAVLDSIQREVQVIKDRGGQVRVEVELEPKQREALAQMRSASAVAKLHESLAGLQSKNSDISEIHLQLRDQLHERLQGKRIDLEAARAELQKAYESVSKAREQVTKDEPTAYVDAARELYNAARREAEQKRYDRAVELARAADSLTKANGLVLKHAPFVTRLFNVEGTPPSVSVEGKPVFELGEIHVGARADDDAGPVQGIGVKITLADGKAVVVEIMTDSPAAKDARIKPGDAILGVQDEKGALTGFADKEIAEVAKRLRGPVGSKVKVVVQSKGSDELKVYEIERKPLEAPKPAEPDKPEDGAALLPPEIN